MSKRTLGIISILVLLLALSLPSIAQESTVRGSLSGTVVDSTGAVIVGAKATITGPTGTDSRQTDSGGHFTFPLLTPGIYSINVTKEGFRGITVKAAEIKTGISTPLLITMQPGAVSETVEVTAATVAVDTTTTAVSSNLPDTFYNSVPVGRGVQNLFYISPGVATSGESTYNPSISGGSALENLYVADGVTINDQAYGGIGVVSALYGSLGTGINLSFIKEVQIKTSGFEPQYGNTTGGVVQIVTKSGGREFHGSVGGFFAPQQLEATRLQRDDVRVNPVGKLLHPSNFDASAELGGYVPGFRDHVFFFGSVSPTWERQYWTAPPKSGLAAIYNQGQINLYRDVYNYAGKLTFRLSDKHTVESSFYGDPAHTSTGDWCCNFNQRGTTAYSKWSYGTRNWVVRYNGTLSPTWLVTGSFTWNRNVFTESPANTLLYQIVNRTETAGLAGQRGVFTQQGFGLLQNHVGDTYAYHVDTQKVVRVLGEHTFSLGFSEEFPNYNQFKQRSGPRFAVPATNLAGGAYFSDSVCPGALCPIGHTQDSQFNLLLAGPNGGKAGKLCTLCPLYPVNGFATPQPVYLSVVRGEFGAGGLIATESKSRAAYFNDQWSLTKRLTITAGIRWDEQHIAGQDVKYTFTDNWSPRIGVAIDPWGDRKTKISAGYNRLHWSIPLDAAIRSLSSELDLLGTAFLPVISGTNITVVPDAAHVLNKAAGGVTTTPSIFTSGGGEFILPGTRMNMADEFMVGFEHEFKNGLVISTRYVDRRLKRIVEDMSGISPELANVGQNAPSFLGNPGPSLDATVNEHKGIPFPEGTVPPASCGATFLATTNSAGLGVEADDANSNPEAGAGNALCWPSVGTVPNTAAAIAAGFTPGDPMFGGEPFPDGKADGFAQPTRVYQAVEIEVNKQFSRNWMMRTSWTISKLQGNYQGAFRGDNGQRDPGISSLFDFTPGFYNLLGDQFKPGVLPSDRRHIINAYFSYVFDKYAVKNLTLGTGVQIASGTPLSNFADHPVYQNSGEVPLGGRGILGRTPVNGQVDVHADYPFKLTERSKVRVGADLFNIANQKTKLTIDQNRDLTSQAANSNLDFLKPLTFQRPFYARFFVRWEF